MNECMVNKGTNNLPTLKTSSGKVSGFICFAILRIVFTKT